MAEKHPSTVPGIQSDDQEADDATTQNASHGVPHGAGDNSADTEPNSDRHDTETTPGRVQKDHDEQHRR
jgi:hypothetical protein